MHTMYTKNFSNYRIRQYSRMETVFDYFATYEIKNPQGKIYLIKINPSRNQLF